MPASEPIAHSPVRDAATSVARAAAQLTEDRLELSWRRAKRAMSEGAGPALLLTGAIGAGVLAWLLFTAAAVVALAPSCGLAGALALTGAAHALVAAVSAWRGSA